jgi:uncharacterized protein (DUF697 family)
MDETQQQVPPVKLPESDSEVEVTILPTAKNNQPSNTSTSQEEPSFLESLAKTVGGVTETITHTGKVIAGTAVDLGEVAAKQAHELISYATQEAGEVVTSVGNNWLVRRLTRFLNLDWLVGATDSVDLAQAEAAVRKLQQEYPNESPSEIAHRIMVEKATYAGGVGLASSILPGVALALLAVDLAATTKLQAEMVYQIAAVYGLDLKDPARKGEVLGIFGLGLGGSRALKAAGLGLLRNVPFAGAMIGASTNAAMLYSLGYAACRFYETKLNSPASVTSEETLETLKQQSDKYLETAIAQQTLMDQILVHMILASHPEKSWEEIQPELKVLNLSPTSIEAIAKNIKSPQPLDILLNQLNRDFAVPLLAQCYRIAQQERVTTPAARKVMEAIATKFDIDMNSIQAAV